MYMPLERGVFLGKPQFQSESRKISLNLKHFLFYHNPNNFGKKIYKSITDSSNALLNQ